MSKKEIAKIEKKEVISAEDQALMEMMSADSADCQDNVDINDLIVPRIMIAQALSTVLKKKNEEKYIPEAEIGCMYNVLTKEVIKGDEGLIFVPVIRNISYVEWADRESGGGILNNYGSDASAYLAAPANDKGAKMGSQAGSEIVKTYNFYGYLFDQKTNSFSQVWIPMSKSQAASAKKLNTLIQMKQDPTTRNTLPCFAGAYKITTVISTNKKGDEWFSYNIDFFDYTMKLPESGLQLYKIARDLFKASPKFSAAVQDEDDRM